MVHGSRSRRRLFIAIVLVAVAALAAFAVYDMGYLGGNDSGSVCKSVENTGVVHDASGGNGSNATFLIIEADYPSSYAGINGSANEPANSTWPVMRVHLGQRVSIHVTNCASTEPHGFQIQHYDDQSINAIPAGKSYDVTFTANQLGQFRVYCDILCAIHPLMQNGLLIVSD